MAVAAASRAQDAETRVGHWQLVALLVTHCLCWRVGAVGGIRSSLRPASAWLQSKALWLQQYKPVPTKDEAITNPHPLPAGDQVICPH